MKNYKIKTATACYTGGDIYIYYGQLENGLYWRAADTWDIIWICDQDTGTEEASWYEFYEQHTIEEITSPSKFKAFWNAMLRHILEKKPTHDEWCNYSDDELTSRMI